MSQPESLWPALAVAGGVALIVAIAGGLLTDIGPWYRALRKPSWQPPDWLFGPAWTLIFTLTAIAAALAWRDAPASARAGLIGLFLVNALLNIAWSGLFFSLKRPDWALIEVVLLWVSIAALIARIAPINGLASLLLTPYLAWVSFAAFLNYTIVQLNR
jgi:tryptophan-rich sensory protein